MSLRRTCLLITLVLAGTTFETVPAAETGEPKTVYAIYWRGCEESCQGYRDYLAENMPGTQVIIRNADRIAERIPGYLDEARKLKPDLLLSWGTTVTLKTAGRLSDLDDPRFNHDIPQIFTIVADPVGSGIIESLDDTGRANLTGTLNRVPETVNINAMRTYLPSFQRLGLIYNSNEPNSVLKKQELEMLAPQMDIELVAMELALDANGAPLVEDIPVKMAQLKEEGVDFLYLGSSSFLNTQRDLFTSSAVENGIPVLSPYEHMVTESNALMSVSARYYQVGLLAGELTEKILKEGVSPGDLPVAPMKNFAYVVNMDVARRLNLFPSVGILQFAETVKN